jgi:uncharacterized SAM-binding protein YcdF (DUF218 family)
MVGPEFVELTRFLKRGALVLAPFLLLSAFTFPRLGAWLVVEDPLEKADAVIVLGGTMYERPLEAVELFKEGWAPRIYLFRQIADWGEALLIERKLPYMREVDLQIEVLGRLGVPREMIGVLDQADSTAEESEDVLALVTREKYSRVIIVTSKQHTRRARLVMNRKMSPAGVKVVLRASRFDRSDVHRWWAQRSTLRFTLFEMQRLLGYWIGVAD